MHKQWWKEAVVYQIYPQSFQDSNGDGFGDLNGIITRLDYLKELGVDVLWLCPIFDSPMFDNGYDVKDYYGIMEKFGTLEDFERLLCRAHEKGLRVVLDAVFNHTSDQHPWFVESRRRDSKYRDYYVWADPVDGHEPNNWMSIFGGSVWEHDSVSDAYYMHLFFKQQPDLNWENPAVRRELRKILEFWCEKGVDGFRFDAINLFSKPEDMSDWPDPYRIGDYANGKHTHPYLQELLKGLDDKYNIMLVGQTDNVRPEDALLFAGFDRGEFQMISSMNWTTTETTAPLLSGIPKCLLYWKSRRFSPSGSKCWQTKRGIQFASAATICPDLSPDTEMTRYSIRSQPKCWPRSKCRYKEHLSSIREMSWV